MQLRNPRGHRDLLDGRGHPDLPGHRATKLDLVANDGARLRIDEAHRLIGGQHAAHELALVFDVRELVRVHRVSCHGQRGEAQHPDLKP